MVWEGEPALTVFHASSAGRTRSAQAVWGQDIPYLVSVDSPEVVKLLSELEQELSYFKFLGNY